MSVIRITIAILAGVTLLAACGFAAPAGSGPALGKWEYTGKDNTGVAWKGTLTIQKLDPDRFDADRFHSICTLDMESEETSKQLEAPCTWAPGTRAVSFSTGVSLTYTYTAVLSTDGKSLTGKWTEAKKDDKKSVVRSGDWSAKLKP